MRNDRQARRTCLFTVRLWLEPLDDGHAEIRGEARHVSSGERRFVRDRAALEAFFAEKLSESEGVLVKVILRVEWFKGVTRAESRRKVRKVRRKGVITMQRKPFVPALVSAIVVAALGSATIAMAQTEPQGEAPPFSPSTAIFANRIFNHGASVAFLAVSPDGGSVASAGADGNVKQWNTKTGALRQTSSVPDGVIWTVDYSPDGKLLAGVGQDLAVHVWDAATGKQVRALQGHETQVQGLNFSPDGKRLLSSSADQTARVWDVATGKELLKISNLGDVTWAYFSNDGKMLITLALTGTVGLWDAASGKAVRTITVLEEPGFVATILPLADGKTIVTSDMNTLRFWDMAIGKEVRSVPTTHTDFIYSVAFSPDGKYMATGSGDKTAKIYEAASGKELFTIKGHTDQVWYVKFTPDSKILATGSFDGTTRLWNIPLWERFMGF